MEEEQRQLTLEEITDIEVTNIEVEGFSGVNVIEINTEWAEELKKVAEGIQGFSMKLKKDVKLEAMHECLFDDTRDKRTNALYIISGTLDPIFYNEVAGKIEDIGDVALNVISRQQIEKLRANKFYQKMKKRSGVRYGYLEHNNPLHGIATIDHSYSSITDGIPHIKTGFVLLEGAHEVRDEKRNIYTTGRPNVLRGFIKYFENLYKQAIKEFDNVIDYDSYIWQMTKSKECPMPWVF